jgi:hypothetical protein
MVRDGRNNLMKKFAGLLFTYVVGTFVAGFSATSQAATVSVSYLSLSPDPVYVVTGGVVDWQDGDDLGPYAISGGWGTFFTPGGIRFNVPPGSYGYSAESAFGGGPFDGKVIVVAPTPPTVMITSPTNNELYTAPATFTFSADASDPAPNNITDVEFWVGTNMVDDVLSAPYTTTVTNLPAGTYTLQAIALNDSLLSATNSVTITVVSPAPITLTGAGMAAGKFVFSANGLGVGTTNVLQSSSNLVNWVPLQTNIPGSTSLNFTNPVTSRTQFYRVMQMN